MSAAVVWGLVASSSLVLGALLALARPWSARSVALVMAFGGGVLISAVAYELVEDGFSAGGHVVLALGLTAGALTFYVGDLACDRLGGDQRKRSDGRQSAGSGPAIALGTILDGVPESVVLGTMLRGPGAVNLAVVAAIFLSNLPEAMAATAGLRRSGWPAGRVLGLWLAAGAVTVAATVAGYSVLGSAAPAAVAFVQAFAAGALITMLADTLMPEAFEMGGPSVGLVTTLGFAVAFALSSLD